MKHDEVFQELRIVDNFYQTSSFFPMPIVLVGTLAEDGQTNLGPYSLCFPYYVAGKGQYAMMLNTRNSSNTARNILRTGKASLNFIPDRKSFMKQTVALGYPGDSTADKMAKCRFHLLDGLAARQQPAEARPQVVQEAVQVFECSWLRELDGAAGDRPQDSYPGPYHDFNGITSETGAHFILRIDHILLKPLYRSAIVGGLRRRLFPRLPVDYGYRDNQHFWISAFRSPYTEAIPKGKGVALSTVFYAANRLDPRVQFTEDACGQLVKVPRVFLNAALQACVDWAVEHDVATVTEKEMAVIRDKRAADK